MNVSSHSDWEQALKAALDTFGHLDVVVNNAGYAHQGVPVQELTEDIYRKSFAVNFEPLMHFSQVVVPYWLSASPPTTPWNRSVVNISSMSAMRTRPGLAYYASSKSALISMTKTFAIELAPKGIRSNAILPVAADTPLFRNSFGPTLGDNPTDTINKFLQGVPMGRLATVEDIANAVGFLSSDEASFITGLEVCVDGGRSL